VDALPIALEHPLPSPADAKPALAPLPVQNVDSQPQCTDSQPIGAAKPIALNRRSGSAWWRSLAGWSAIAVVALYILLWIVNWKP
jgi:hypothetical protein